MRKAFLLYLLTYIILVSGCSQKNTQETVLYAYESWIEMVMNVWVVGPKVDGNLVTLLIEGENSCYQKVTDENFPSLNSIKDAVEEICTVSCAEELFYIPYLDTHKLYVEKDGVLYRELIEIPMNHGGELINFQIIEKRSDFISARMEFRNDFTEYNHIIDISISLQDSKWLVDSLNQTFVEVPTAD